MKNDQSSQAIRMASETAYASAEVIGRRLGALTDPSKFATAKQMRDVSSMVSEKVQAAVDGWTSAGFELGMLPYRMALLFCGTNAFTPHGSAKAWSNAGSLWLGVANAAWAPTRAKVVSNRSKLRRQD